MGILHIFHCGPSRLTHSVILRMFSQSLIFYTRMLVSAGGPTSNGTSTLRQTLSLPSLPRSRRLILLLLLAAGIHPNPGPASTALKVMQWNCNGLKNSSAELNNFLREHKVGVCCIQETKLKDDDRWPPSFPGYNLIAKNRPRRGGGGIAFLVHFSISFLHVDTSNLLPNDNFSEIQAITVFPDTSPLTIINAYLPPPVPSYLTIDFASILDLSNNDFLLVGDFNAHHPQWFSSIASDARGDALVTAVDNSSAAFLNDDVHTRRSSNPNSSNSSPDISIASAHLVPSVTWSTIDGLNSDHLPIVISLFGDDPAVPRTRSSYTNFRRANWPGFRDELERLVGNLPQPRSCMQGEKLLREAVNTASKHNIPLGYRPVFTPCLTLEAKRLTVERDRLRTANPLDPEVTRLNKEISDQVTTERRRRFNDYVNEADPSQDTRAHFAFMRKLTGKFPSQTISLLVLEALLTVIRRKLLMHSVDNILQSEITTLATLRIRKESSRTLSLITLLILVSSPLPSTTLWKLSAAPAIPLLLALMASPIFI